MSECGYFTVWVATCGYKRFVRTSSEREAALRAEAVVRLMYEEDAAFGITVEGPDRAACRRIAAYLDDVVLEVSTVSGLGS